MFAHRHCFAALLWALLPGFAAIFTPSPAAAQPVSAPERPWTVQWQSGDPDCGQQPMDDLLASLQGKSDNPFIPVSATVRVQRAEKGYRVDLVTEVGDHSGRRSFEADTCKEIQAGVALLLAMILEAKDMPESPEITSETSTVPEPEPTIPPPRPVVPSPTEPVIRDALLWRAELNSLTRWGSVPQWGLGLGSRVAVQWGAWEMAVHAGVIWGSKIAALDGLTGTQQPRELTVAVRRIEASLATCLQLVQYGALSGLFCAGAGLHQDKAQFTLGETKTALGNLRPHGNVTFRGIFEFSHVFFSAEPLLTVEKVQPLRGQCPAGGTPVSLCGTTQFAADTIQLGLLAGIGARF